jgi:hypothetical protein
MSWDQNAGRSHNIKTDDKFFERMEQFKYLGKTWTNQTSTQVEIKCMLKSGNACHHSARNLLSSILLSKNIKIKRYRTVVLPVVLYGCETWSLTLREECRLRVLRMEYWGEYLGLRGTRQERSGENWAARNLMICIPHQILFRWSNRKKWDERCR